MAAQAVAGDKTRLVRGKCYVTKDVSLLGSSAATRHLLVLSAAACAQNIDTDQIIPAEHLTLVPSDVRLSKQLCAPLLCHLHLALKPGQCSQRSTRSWAALR